MLYTYTQFWPPIIDRLCERQRRGHPRQTPLDALRLQLPARLSVLKASGHLQTSACSCTGQTFSSAVKQCALL
jgi:hypothetical protein